MHQLRLLWQSLSFHFQRKSLMKNLTACILIATATLAASAFAADMPSAPEPVKTTAAQYLSNARAAIKSKDWTRALSELNAAVRDEPGNADIHNLLGYSYRKQSAANLPKAFEHYNMALKIDPKHKGAHEYIGEAYLMDGKPAEAEKHLAELERICGNRACEEYGDLAKSIAEYKAKN
jgi:Flp pilus assembly protein TadD